MTPGLAPITLAGAFSQAGAQSIVALMWKVKAEVAEEFLTTGFALGGKQLEARVMFSDIRSFTHIAESQPAAETIDLLSWWPALIASRKARGSRPSRSASASRPAR